MCMWDIYKVGEETLLNLLTHEHATMVDRLKRTASNKYLQKVHRRKVGKFASNLVRMFDNCVLC
jgi:hypothetical protein